MKVYFTDFWVGFNPSDNFIINALKKYHALVVDEESPDVLFFSCYGNNHMRYQCIKVYYTGENDTPNFTWCDYAMGFDDLLSFGDRYLRLPLYAIQPRFKEVLRPINYDESLFDRRFCNFVYSNDRADPFRLAFFHRLSEYKPIDSGGLIENNIGGPVADKLSFISNYKFTLAFENSAYSGYTTEKLLEPMICKSIPIYFGNPNVALDFNPAAFVWVKDEGDMERAIEEIRFLDQNREEYFKKLSYPKTSSNSFWNADDLINNFLGHIFEDPLILSIRRPQYGFSTTFYNGFVQGTINWDSRRQQKDDNNNSRSLPRFIRKFIRRFIRVINCK